MSFRELTMTDVKEVLRRWTAGQSVRQMARESGVDRKTVRRYIEAAKSVGLTLASPLDDGALEEIVRRVQSRPVPAPSSVRKTIETLRPRIDKWLQQEPRPLRLSRIHELLMREGYTFSYTALRRYAHRELGWREHRSPCASTIRRRRGGADRLRVDGHARRRARQEAQALGARRDAQRESIPIRVADADADDA